MRGSTQVHVSLVRRNLTDDEPLYEKDHFVAENSTTTWRNEGSGLILEVVNALDDTWQDEFTLAVSDWDNGDPDAMTLNVTRGEVDYSCKDQDGVLKVCSGNFGRTGWLAMDVFLAIVSADSMNEIFSSVVKMNEYYLRNAEDAERQYSICHQLGDGFGLTHT
jgi:hypothetical protein